MFTNYGEKEKWDLEVKAKSLCESVSSVPWMLTEMKILTFWPSQKDHF